jgi:rhomboid protease GluP
MIMDDREALVIETFLSKKPAGESGPAAVFGLLTVLGFSLLFWSDIGGYASRLPASQELVLAEGQYWRLFTTIFIHADLRHLVSNAPGILGFGYLLYGYYGFKVYPCITLISGALVTLISLITYPPRTFLLGASGVIYFMAAFWLTLYIFLERRFTFGRRFLRAAGFVLIVLFPTSFSPETSYRAHTIGFGVGVAVAIFYFFMNKDRFRREEVVETDWE